MKRALALVLSVLWLSTATAFERPTWCDNDKKKSSAESTVCGDEALAVRFLELDKRWDAYKDSQADERVKSGRAYLKSWNKGFFQPCNDNKACNNAAVEVALNAAFFNESCKVQVPTSEPDTVDNVESESKPLPKRQTSLSMVAPQPELKQPHHSQGLSMVANTAPTPPKEEKPAATSGSGVLDVPKIAGQSKDTVKQLLGEPKECNPNKYGEKCDYQPMSAEIVFIDGKADWMTVNELESADYDKSTLTLMGLEPSEPDFSNENVMKWKNKQGLLEVSLFPQGKKVFYAYIKAKTQ